MTAGIFNPYAAPPKPKAKKRDFQSTIDVKNPYNSEYTPGKGHTTDISLDGDTYVVVFHDAKVDTVTKRLGELMQDLIRDHAEELQRYGINFNSAISSPSELVLQTPLGLLRVDTGGEQNEVVAYRRLGYALSRMNVKPLLKKHAIRVYLRG